MDDDGDTVCRGCRNGDPYGAALWEPSPLMPLLWSTILQHRGSERDREREGEGEGESGKGAHIPAPFKSESAHTHTLAPAPSVPAPATEFISPPVEIMVDLGCGCGREAVWLGERVRELGWGGEDEDMGGGDMAASALPSPPRAPPTATENNSSVVEKRSVRIVGIDRLTASQRRFTDLAGRRGVASFVSWHACDLRTGKSLHEALRAWGVITLSAPAPNPDPNHHHDIVADEDLVMDEYSSPITLMYGARFLHRPLFAEMARLVRVGGWVGWAHFQRKPDVPWTFAHPSHPDDILEADELRRHFPAPTWAVRVERVTETDGGRPFVLFVAQKMAPIRSSSNT